MTRLLRPNFYWLLVLVPVSLIADFGLHNDLLTGWRALS